MDRPASIIRFERLYFLSLAVSAIAIALQWGDILGEAQAEMPDGAETIATGIGIVTLLVIGGLSILLWYLVARRGSTVAKWIFIVLTGFGIVGMLARIVTGVPLDLAMVADVINNGLAFVCAWLLVQPDVTEWMRSGGPRSAINPRTFD